LLIKTVRSLGLAAACCLVLINRADAEGIAQAYLRSAMTAMGGESRLRGITAIEFRAVGTRMMVEQSERPSGPYFIDHFRLHEIRDIVRARSRIEQADEAYAGDQWWLDQTEPFTNTTVLNDDVAAMPADGTFTYAGGSLVQQNHEQFAFGPERLLQTAAAALDLRALPDTTLGGVRRHVVAFSWQSVPCRLTLDAHTGLPWSISWTRAYPYQTFLNAWGDVTSTLTYNSWTLEPYGLSYPREWTYERLGLPDTQFSIVSLKINSPLSDDDLTVPADIFAAHHHKVRPVSAVPLGYGGSGAAHEIAPGIFVIPGGWNVAFVVQPAGLIMLEAPWSPEYTQRAMDAAVKRYQRPVIGVITTSDSWPHIAGVRQAVARGIPVYALDLNLPILKRLVGAAHRQIPDLLAQHPMPANFRAVARRMALGTTDTAMEVIPYRTATGERQMIVYFPRLQLLYTSDLFAPDGDGWFTPQYLHELTETVEREHLTVKTIFGMHYDPTPYRTVTEYLRAFTSAGATPQAVATGAPSQIAALSNLLGTWSCSGTFPVTGKPISSTMSLESALGGTAIVKHHDDVAPNLYHAIETWHVTQGRLVDTIVDNGGGVRAFDSEGWHDGTLTWRSAPGVAPAQQFVYERLPSGTIRVDWLVAKDGTHFAVGDTLTCVRTTS